MILTVLIGLASYRIWRLVAVDSITEPPRQWLYTRAPEWVVELVECGWCFGAWLAFGVTWATDVMVGVEAPVLVGLGAAVVVGWLSENA